MCSRLEKRTTSVGVEKVNWKKDDMTTLNRKKERPCRMSAASTVKNVTADQ